MKTQKYAVPKYAMTERGLRKLIKEASKKHGSFSDWAIAHKITPQAVSAFLRKQQGAGLQIPAALGLKPQTVFIPVDEEPITVAPPPRRLTKRPTSKVDHTREPIEKKGLKKKDSRKEVKKSLKARKG